VGVDDRILPISPVARIECLVPVDEMSPALEALDLATSAVKVLLKRPRSSPGFVSPLVDALFLQDPPVPSEALGNQK
jgi:hypothetical protein